MSTQPAHTTNEMWAFIQDLEALESADTEFAGSYTDKPGYHNTRDNLIREGLTHDYSIQLTADKQGPGDKTAAVDWTFLSAQAGKYDNIRKYGYRIRAAWVVHDPRLTGWREVLIQGDPDDPADGYDFVSWTERTPDSTHRWHAHFSKLRAMVADKKSYDAMMSILRGQSLADWQSGASMQPGDVAAEKEANAIIIWNIKGWLLEAVGRIRNIENIVTAMAAKIDIDPAELEAIKAASAAGATAAITASVPVLADALAAKLPAGTLTRDQIEEAFRDVLEGGLILGPDPTPNPPPGI